jgi:hypothetical protein
VFKYKFHAVTVLESLFLKIFLLFYKMYNVVLILEIGHKIQSRSPKGTVVGQLRVMDEDAGQSHVFSLVLGGEGQFVVSENGLVTKATDQHLESGRVYDISVEAVDDGHPPLKVNCLKERFLKIEFCS